MMLLFEICLLAAALAADVFIYRNLVRPRGWSKAVKTVVSVSVVLPDFLVVAMPLLYSFLDNRNPLTMHILMWCTFSFILVLLFKLFLVAGCVAAKRRGSRIYALAGIAAGLACAAVMICGATVGRSTIRVERIQVSSPLLPEGFDSFRIVQFSDLHVGSLMNPERFISRLVDTVRSLSPDLVAFTGDLVNIRYSEITPPLFELLSRIDAPYGVYSVLGNHDLGFYIKDTLALPVEQNLHALSEIQRSLGWCLLSDSSVYVHAGGDSILLTGLGFPQQARLHGHNSVLAGTDVAAAYASADTAVYNLVLAHAPQLWDTLCEMNRSDLTLSGHVHAMQMKLRLFGREFSPARAVYEHWSGAYRRGLRTLYVNDGLGCVMYPMRIGARPEVTLIELRRCE